VLIQRRAIEVASFVLGLSGMLGTAHAQPLLVSLEGQAAVAVTTPQSERFGPGLNVALSVRYPLGPVVQIGAEARAGLLSAGEEEFASGQAEPQPGSYELGMLMLRVKPLAMVDGTSPRRAAGLFLDLGAGGGVTGKLARVGFQGGLGFGFGLGGGITIAPTVRYLQVIQPADPLSSRDARLMSFGLELSAFDAVARVHRAPPERVVKAPPPAAVVETDRDHDGVDNARDQCPDAAEDDDGFEDADGCPELDNDRDGVADARDACPDAAEDLDGNDDADGCPDAGDDDRDHDHIVDANDKCPDEPEVVNGKDDEDGCPDEGLIVLEDDRIVLDAQVLFDAGFARVRHAAWAALDAIGKLKQQHPEWVKIRVEGHADARGPEKLNQRLSERRARNAMKYLIKIGVPAEQLESHGYGSSQPRDPGKSDEANKRNRRVEFVVIRASPQESEAAPERSEAAKQPALRLDAPAEPQPQPPATPQAVEEAPPPPPPPALPPKSGLTPSGLRPLPAEKK
jgi:outer membrane protein OmpA-like peptidoglycan-associated protein